MPVFSCIRNIHQKRVKVYIGRQLSVTGNIKAGLEVRSCRSCRSFKMSDGSEELLLLFSMKSTGANRSLLKEQLERFTFY